MPRRTDSLSAGSLRGLKSFGENNIREGAPLRHWKGACAAIYASIAIIEVSGDKLVVRHGRRTFCAARRRTNYHGRLSAPANERRVLRAVLATLTPDVFGAA